jgi:polysaccharide biosynthesis protein PslG
MGPASLLLRRAVAPLVAAGALAAPAAAVAAPLEGVAIGRPTAPEAEWRADLDRVQALGVRAVRTDLPWEALEPTGPGQLDPAALARADAFFAEARRRGIRPVVQMLVTPCWASSAPEAERATCRPGAQDAATAYPPRDPQDFARIAAFVAGRWGAGLTAFEVWNEPDQANEKYFKGPDKVARYAALLKAAYPALKRAAPSLPVLGGALVGADGRFLTALYRAGIKGSYDGLSVHFYDLPLAQLRLIRQAQLRNGDTKPVWLMETGWTSCAPAQRTQDQHTCVTAGQQARNLRDLVGAVQRTSYLRGLFVFALRDAPELSFGLFDRSGARKPAFGVLREAFRSPRAPRRPTLRLRRAGGRITASGTGPAGDALGLEVRVRGRLRYRANFRLDRDGAYRLRLPRALGTRGLRVRVQQFWTGRDVTRRS